MYSEFNADDGLDGDANSDADSGADGDAVGGDDDLAFDRLTALMLSSFDSYS